MPTKQLEYVKDLKLSFKSIGLLTRIIARVKEDPDFSPNFVNMGDAVKDGGASIQQSFKELVDMGYGFIVTMTPDGEKYESHLYMFFESKESCFKALEEFGTELRIEACSEYQQRLYKER